MSEAARKPAGVRERRAAIDPYLELIGAGGPAVERENRSTCITVENRIIELDEWEWAALSRGLDQQDDASAVPRIEDWPRRLAEGVAFQARYLTHISRLQDGPPPAPAELETFRAELITDTAVGLAIQEELQRDVNNLVALGALDEAKKLTSFRHKIGQGIGRLKDTLGRVGFEQAEAKAAEILAPAPRQPRIKSKSGPSEIDELPVQFRRDVDGGHVRHLERKDSKSRLRPLLLALAVSAVLWGVSSLATRRAEGPRPLDDSDFGKIHGVDRVEARPPSLFVTVQSKPWRAMSEAERSAVVKGVGEIAGKNGYSGVHFRSTAGDAVAEWLKRGGPRLFAAPANNEKS